MVGTSLNPAPRAKRTCSSLQPNLNLGKSNIIPRENRTLQEERRTENRKTAASTKKHIALATSMAHPVKSVKSTYFPDDIYPPNRMTVYADASGLYYLYTIVNKTHHIVPFKYLSRSIEVEPNEACILKSRSALSVYFNKAPSCLCHRQTIYIEPKLTVGYLIRGIVGGATVGFTFGTSLLLAEVDIERQKLV
ncbi:hypothetical protein HK102_004731 [Quaeritorhiza haematococci]|nr:hypothetical protein HK102_004731 [Quaeritorhiza haematococci]